MSSQVALNIAFLHAFHVMLWRLTFFLFPSYPEAMLSNSNNEIDDSNHLFFYPNSRRRLLVVVFSFAAIILGLGAYLFIALALAAFPTHAQHVSSYNHESTQFSRRSKTCEMPPSTAMAQGCKFDILSFSWLPAPCFDGELTSQFLAMKPEGWKWYALDSAAPGYYNHSIQVGADDVVEIDIAEVQQGNYSSLLVTNDYHFYHCLFAWRKLHRALQGFANMDSYIVSLNHTNHCVHMLGHYWEGSKEMSGSKLETIISRKTPQCWL